MLDILTIILGGIETGDLELSKKGVRMAEDLITCCESVDESERIPKCAQC